MSLSFHTTRITSHSHSFHLIIPHRIDLLTSSQVPSRAVDLLPCTVMLHWGLQELFCIQRDEDVQHLRS